MAGTPKNKRPIVSDRAVSIASLFLSLVAAGGQGIYPNWFPLWVACLTIGFGGLLWTLLNALTCTEGVIGKFAAKYKLYLHSVILTITVALCATAWDRAQQLMELPDVELVLVDPVSVNIMIENPTDKVANQPKYFIALWNLEHPERKSPLPIPSAKNDYLLAHRIWGPNQMMGISQVIPLVKAGDHLFGYAQVLCLDCKREHWYWVYVDHGKEGWFCEMQIGQVNVWPELLHQLTDPSDRERWIDEQAPIVHRKIIKKSPWNTS
jgi:hypothetical protein